MGLKMRKVYCEASDQEKKRVAIKRLDTLHKKPL